MNVLVTGGAGYIGQILVPMLREHGHAVIVFDSLQHGQSPFLDRTRDSKFLFIRGDVTWPVSEIRERIGQAVDDHIDAFVHLAAMVGAPLCHAEPAAAEAVNVSGTANMVEVAGFRRFIFASTDSCYGAKGGVPCDEETTLEPLTEYGSHKARGELLVRGSETDWSILRFATAFGVSPRMRLDLLVNDLCWTAYRLRSLVIYEARFMRTFLHVRDIARAICLALEAPSGWNRQIVNVGDDFLNVTKAQLADIVAMQVPGCLLNLTGDGKDPDGRNHIIDHAKVRALGFKASIGIEEGTKEILTACPRLSVPNPFSNVGRAF